MEKISIELSGKEITEMVKESIEESIQKSLKNNKEQIEKSINEYFKKSFFDNKASQFESALDCTVERAFREGLNKAMEELNFKEIIAQKAKELLSNQNFIIELAEKKVRSSLGLENK